MGKVYGSLACAGKVKGQIPQNDQTLTHAIQSCIIKEVNYEG